MGGTTRSVFLLVLSCVLVRSVPVAEPPIGLEGPGTTPRLHEIFLGRCWDYQLVKHKDLTKTIVDCDALWDTFSSAFMYKPECDVTLNDYKPFMDHAYQDFPENRTLLWSGTYTIAHAYADFGNRFITLEDTLVGYLVNSLRWCGQILPPGHNAHQCPVFGSCSDEADVSFWGSASSAFASRSSGLVTLVLDGSNPTKPAYRNDSFFGQFEFPSLQTRFVSLIRIVLIHDLGQEPLEDCGTGSLAVLEDMLAERGFNVECIQNPDAVLFLMCAEAPDSRECRHVQDILFRSHPSTKHQIYRYRRYKRLAESYNQ